MGGRLTMIDYDELYLSMINQICMKLMGQRGLPQKSRDSSEDKLHLKMGTQ